MKVKTKYRVNDERLRIGITVDFAHDELKKMFKVTSCPQQVSKEAVSRLKSVDNYDGVHSAFAQHIAILIFEGGLLDERLKKYRAPKQKKKKTKLRRI